MRSFAYNILRCNQTSSFNQDRYAAALAGLDALAALGRQLRALNSPGQLPEWRDRRLVVPLHMNTASKRVRRRRPLINQWLLTRRVNRHIPRSLFHSRIFGRLFSLLAMSQLPDLGS